MHTCCIEPNLNYCCKVQTLTFRRHWQTAGIHQVYRNSELRTLRFRIMGYCHRSGWSGSVRLSSRIHNGSIRTKDNVTNRCYSNAYRMAADWSGKLIMDASGGANYLWDSIRLHIYGNANLPWRNSFTENSRLLDYYNVRNGSAWHSVYVCRCSLSADFNNGLDIDGAFSGIFFHLYLDARIALLSFGKR